MKQHFITSLKAMTFFSVVLGVVYPVVITFFAQTFFPQQANGSLIERDGKIIGSHLIAQKTTSDRYFWPRPSASDYGAVPSGASNLGPTSKVLKQAMQDRKAKGMALDLLFASGSGLDPHISLDAALSQVERIVQSRQLSDNGKTGIVELIRRSVEPRDFGIFGEPRINVLQLNIEIDKMALH